MHTYIYLKILSDELLSSLRQLKDSIPHPQKYFCTMNCYVCVTGFHMMQFLPIKRITCGLKDTVQKKDDTHENVVSYFKFSQNLTIFISYFQFIKKDI